MMLRAGRAFAHNGEAKAAFHLLLVCLVCLQPLSLMASEDVTDDLTALSLEELMEIKVFSVAKKPQKLSETAAAIFVITAEDLRRSGVTSIPEALRMVPGLQVSRLNSNRWAVTSRGFNGRYSNKLLVLIDGRSVYTPLFSGVFWETRDTLLEDIDRIEVIRGPGASLWGANAVNGVINIITKTAKDTQGTLLNGGVGTEEQGFVSFRHGGKMGDKGHWRFYGKYFNRDSTVFPSGEDGFDDWDMFRAGFRADFEPSGKDTLTLSGDIHNGDVGSQFDLTSLVPPYSQTVKVDTLVSGGYLLGRWAHEVSESSDTVFQFFYDRTYRSNIVADTVEETIDLDFQHRFRLLGRHEVSWGIGYRYNRVGLDRLTFQEGKPEDHILSGFVQGEFGLLRDQLGLVLGSKFEQNEFTGFEVQPTAKMIWEVAERNTIWTSVSRAVRTPSFAETGIRQDAGVIEPGEIFPLSPLVLVSFLGNRDFKSEELTAFEFGFRTQPVDRISLDLAGFYNIYDNLRTVEFMAPYVAEGPGLPYIVIPLQAGNKMDGETYGVELAASLSLFDWWVLKGSYTFLQMQLHLDEDSTDAEGVGMAPGRANLTAESAEGDSPHHQVSVRSSMDLPHSLEVDLWLRYVDGLPSQAIPGYASMDVRLGWSPVEGLELSVVGQNLLDPQRTEYIPEAYVPTSALEVQRGVYGKVTWQF